MFLKKPVASAVCAAFLMTGPGRLTTEALAGAVAAPQSGAARAGAPGNVVAVPVLNQSGVSIMPLAPANLGLGASLLPTSAPRLDVAAAPAATAPSLPIVNASIAPVKTVSAAALVETLETGESFQVIQSRDAKVTDSERAAALDAVFDMRGRKDVASDDAVIGAESRVRSGLAPARMPDIVRGGSMAAAPETAPKDGDILARFPAPPRTIRTVIAPDGRHVAHLVRNDVPVWGRVRVFLDGKPGLEFDETYHKLIFSPDSRHFGYIAKSGPDEYFTVIDGQIGPKHYHADYLTFSPDSQHVAYVANDDISSEDRVLVDGKPGPEFHQIAGPIFSPDSRHVGYTARTYSPGDADEYFAVVDGKVGPGLPYAADLTFSPDSRNVAYTASDGRYSPHRVFSIAGRIAWWRAASVLSLWKPKPKFVNVSAPIFSSDGRRTAYIATQYMPQGGGPGSVGQMFQLTSRHDSVVVDGKPGPWFDRIKDIAFTPDGRHVTYQAYSDAKNRWTLMEDDKPASAGMPLIANQGRRFFSRYDAYERQRVWEAAKYEFDWAIKFLAAPISLAAAFGEEFAVLSLVGFALGLVLWPLGAAVGAYGLICGMLELLDLGGSYIGQFLDRFSARRKVAAVLGLRFAFGLGPAAGLSAAGIIAAQKPSAGKVGKPFLSFSELEYVMDALPGVEELAETLAKQRGQDNNGISAKDYVALMKEASETFAKRSDAPSQAAHEIAVFTVAQTIRILGAGAEKAATVRDLKQNKVLLGWLMKMYAAATTGASSLQELKDNASKIADAAVKVLSAPAVGNVKIEFSFKIGEDHQSLLSEVFAANSGEVLDYVENIVGKGVWDISLFVPYATEQSGGNIMYVVTVVKNGRIIGNFRAEINKRTKKLDLLPNDD